MPDVSTAWPWISLSAMGAFHGLNPAMGWLFAVAIGLQERRLRAVFAALGPIAIGHAVSIAFFAVTVGLLGLVVPQQWLLIGGGLTLLGFTAWKVATRFRCLRWVGMRLTRTQLAFWSFLMATVHGAGLMLVPPLIALENRDAPAAAAQSEPALAHMNMSIPMAMPMPTAVPAANGATARTGEAVAALLGAVAVHTAALLLVAALVAVVVYRKVGVDVVRRAWINLDYIWAAALAVTGGITLAVGLWQAIAR